MTHLSKKRKNGYPKGVFRDVFICSKQELSPFGTVFTFSADNIEEQKLGTIFGIIKIDDHSENSSYVANLLTSVIKKEYFSKPHRPAEESFEASLRKANLALAELARHGSLGWSGKLNFTSGALERNNLHFACLGKVSVYLLRGGQIAEISRDLEEGLDAETHPLKTFSNISSGKLEKGDKLILTTYDLSEIFSKEELRQNAAHFSREEFPGLLEMSLRANSELAGIIVIDLVDESEAKPAIVEAPLIGGEKIRKIDSFVGFPEEESSAGPGALAPGEEFRLTFRQKFPTLLKNLPAYVSDKAKRLFLKLASFFQRSSYREKTLSAIYSSGRKIGRGLAGAKNKFHSLEPAKKKAVLGILGGVAAIAAVALIVFWTKGKKAAEPAPQPGNVPAETQLPLALDDIEARAVENIEEVASLPQEGNRFAILGESLYAISGKNRIVTKINLDSKATEEIKSSLSSGNFGLISAMPHLKALFILTEDKKVIALTPINKNFQDNTISLPANTRARDIKSYLTYLYILDIANNQVYRYPRAEGGFGEGQAWLRSVSDLKNAKGIAINDDLYLAENEKITPYLQGKKDEKINFDSSQTPLSIDIIYSEPEMEFVYVLDSKNRRIVRYTKDGKISAQYLNESISEVKDFAVDEKNKTIYLLQGNEIKKFSIE
ncbi:MAG: hypothetical protein COZ87_03510 [Candidatus Moranbacteria bacterium CG_4_8_14_3_um_filter_43_15]|nr:MAG: hypothetical protein COZ87_03510 [Candidatus Moranbacteria bacterium CG_4_8_14_3_um_filter_43_15]